MINLITKKLKKSDVDLYALFLDGKRITPYYLKMESASQKSRLKTSIEREDICILETFDGHILFDLKGKKELLRAASISFYAFPYCLSISSEGLDLIKIKQKKSERYIERLCEHVDNVTITDSFNKRDNEVIFKIEKDSKEYLIDSEGQILTPKVDTIHRPTDSNICELTKSDFSYLYHLKHRVLTKKYPSRRFLATFHYPKDFNKDKPTFAYIHLEEDYKSEDLLLDLSRSGKEFDLGDITIENYSDNFLYFIANVGVLRKAFIDCSSGEPKRGKEVENLLSNFRNFDKCLNKGFYFVSKNKKTLVYYKTFRGPIGTLDYSDLETIDFNTLLSKLENFKIKLVNRKKRAV